MLNSYAEYILEYLSDKMLVTTVMFWVAIAIAVTSIVCFILAPIYSKGKHDGVKILAQIISIIDFVGGIGSMLVFVVVSVLSLLTSAGAFADASLSVQETLLAILLTPIRFGMPIDSFASGDLSAGTVILFYGLYFGVAGLLGIIAFVVSSSARCKYNGANGKIRGAAVPQGMPQYNPYQPYGQPNIQQGYPQQYGQNAQQGYPQQYQQNVPQGYPQQYQQNAQQGYPQQYQQNVQQGYPQQYQQNAQYQSTSGETTVLTPEMLAHPVAPVPVMNSQPVPGYAEPAPEVAQQETPVEPAPEVAQQEMLVDPAPEVAQQETPVEPAPEVAQQETPVEPVPEVAQQETPVEPAPEVAQQEMSVEPAPEVAQQEMPVEPAPEVAQQEVSVKLAPEVAQQETPVEPVPEVAQQEMSVEPANETTQPGISAEPEPAGFCVNCGNALSQGAIFCSNCGYRVNNAPAAFCTGCGAKLPDGALFCTTCGKKRDM